MSFLSPTPGTAGWFDDPAQPGVTRYWDGTGWTERSFGEPLPVAPAGAPAGWTSPPRPRLARPTLTDRGAIWSLVLGLLASLCFLSAVFAITTGVSSRKRIRLAGGELTGDGLALAGIIMGAFWLAAALLMIVVLASMDPQATSGYGQ